MPGPAEQQRRPGLAVPVTGGMVQLQRPDAFGQRRGQVAGGQVGVEQDGTSLRSDDPEAAGVRAERGVLGERDRPVRPWVYLRLRELAETGRSSRSRAAGGALRNPPLFGTTSCLRLRLSLARACTWP
jgi:hypothetical protein